jgi:nitroreductase
MDALEAIRTRRMRPRVRDDAPNREEIEELLALAVRAPNHLRTEPWRFRVMVGEGRQRLAKAIAEEAAGGPPDGSALEEARKKVHRAPVIIAATCVPGDGPKVVEREEMASVAMAVQNILLGAEAMGLGVMLRTGPAAYHPVIRKYLDLEPNEEVVGFIYLGHPAADRSPTERRPAAELTRWMEDAG